MRHPSDGVLRRLLDEPAGVSDADRAHLTGCPQCLDTLATMRTDATALDSALAPQGSPDVDAAWRRLSAATAEPERVATPRRSRPAMRRPVVAAVAAAVVLTGAGTAAANDWLQIFRTEQVQPVALSTADLIALPDLSAYGDVVVTGDGDLRTVDDAAAAEAESGLELPEVADLPRGISGEPTYQVGSEISATFTFSADRAAQAAAAAGETLPPAPAGLDGATVRMVAGPGVAQAWESSAGVPALVVGRAVAPTAYSSGVPFETLRDHLLSLPGLPDDVAAQLSQFTADGGTLPLPVPSDRVSTSTAEVDGVQATVLELADRSMSAVVWVDEGVVTAVAGSLDTDEVLSVAQGLR